MTIEQATWLAEIVEGEVREEYSGRGMYGKSEAAVVVEADMPHILARLWECNGDEEDSIGVPGQVRFDNLGDSIVLY